MNKRNKIALLIVAIVSAVSLLVSGVAYAVTAGNTVACDPASVTYNADGSGTCSVEVTVPGLVKTATATVTQTQTATATATVTQTVTATPTPTQPTSTATATVTATATPPPGTFPNASNTGVPAGTTLTAYTGSCTISTANTTINAKTITCPHGLLIRAANVTITKSKVVVNASDGGVLVDTDVNQAWSLTLTDSDVQGPTGDLPAITNGNVNLLRDNIQGGHNGLECQEHSHYCSIKDSFIHNQYDPHNDNAHLGGMLGLGTVVSCTGTNGLCMEVVHNSITCDSTTGCTGDLQLLPHFGPLNSALVQNNYFGANANAAYCTYGGAGMEYPAKNIKYTGNVFARGTNSKCAAYGPVTNFDSNASGNVWTNNLWDDGTTVLPEN